MPVPVAVPQPLSVLVLSPNYPAPIVGQGATGFVSSNSYVGQVAHQHFNFDRYAQQRLELKKADQVTGALDMQRLDQYALQVATLQAPAIEIREKGVALAQGFAALGGTNYPPQQQAMIVNRDAYGKFQVTQISAQQLQSLQGQYGGQPVPQQPHYPGETAPQPPGPPPSPVPQPGPTGGQFPLVAQFCNKCHGLNVPNPGKGLFIGPDTNTIAGMKAKWYEITTAVGGGNGKAPTMPPTSEPQPSPEERRALISELQAMIGSVPSS